MQRSALALGASILALALTAGPAGAQSGGPQTVTDSNGAAQVGPAEVNAPIRVLSDGNNESPDAGASVGAPQTTTDSEASAQTGPAEVNAPVRVLSDGENGAGGQ